MNEYAELTIDAIFDAYFDCRKSKRNSINQLRFEANLESNLVQLYYDLISGHYKIGHSVAFIITYPKIREVWAADFRDRIVHHLIYRAVFQRFHKSFIRDSYACIPNRGVHDGYRRVAGFVRSITYNWTKSAYFLKIDVANFFNSIDHQITYDLMKKKVQEPWLLKLIEQVIFHDPRKDALMHSRSSLFEKVPRHKSYLHAPSSKGLPIGNLTSQFYANMYLNELDQFVKHRLKVKYYGRYMDDMVLFHENAAVLNDCYVKIDEFLKSHLQLHLHPYKKHLNLIHSGVDFTGFVIKPGRTYIRHSTISNCKRKIKVWKIKGEPIDELALEKLSQTVNSYLGMLRQVNGYRARKSICTDLESLFLRADEEFTKLTYQ